MGILDTFFPDDQNWTPDYNRGVPGLLSPTDRATALWQGLTQLGAGMAAPGNLSPWQRLGLGAAGLGQGINQGQQQALQQRFMQQKLAEEMQKQQWRKTMASAFGEGGMPSAPIGVAGPNQPVAQAMQDRMNSATQDKLAQPAVQGALLGLYGPAGLAALRADDTPIKLGPNEIAADRRGRVLARGERVPMTDVGKLQAERDMLPKGDPRRADYDAEILKRQVEGGFRIGAQGMSPMAGGPADPRYQQSKSYAEAAGSAPFKTVPVQAGGSVVTPFASGSSAGTGLPPGVAYQDPRPAPNSQAGEIEKYLAERFVETQKAGNEGRRRSQSLDRVQDLMDQAYTGVGGETVLAAQRAAKALGLDIGNPAPGEAGTALAREFALQLRNPSGGAGMPGALSDSDRRFLESMSGSIGMTHEGRKMLFDMHRRLVKRDQEVAEFARQYARDRGGKIDLYFDDALAKEFGDKPLFDDLQKKAAPSSGPQGQRQSGELPTFLSPDQAKAANLPSGSAFYTGRKINGVPEIRYIP